MTRHSNTLVFGTNTSFGVKVGADATSTPGITVGYSRQEAVVIPVVANTADNGQTQGPCPQVAVPGATVASVPDTCRLVGKEGNEQDAYSVLASFGAKFGADVDGVARKADGQIAQYFATGLAARRLAENGGAATVALGSAARANANALGSERLLALTQSPAAQQRLEKNLSLIDAARTTIVTKIGASKSLRDHLKRMDDALGGASTFATVCPEGVSAAACAVAIQGSGTLGLMPKEWETAASVLNGGE